MPMPKDELQEDIVNSWRIYLDGLENSIKTLDQQIKEASEMADTCTSEWCEATEHVIDELSNSLFAIHEPPWSSKEDEQRLKALRRRVRELYADYRDVYRQVGIRE